MKSKTKGIIYIILSAFFFSIMAASVKAIPKIPTMEKMFFRNLFGIIPIIIISYKNNVSLKPNNTKLIVFRSILGLLGIYAYYTAIELLKLADAVIINKLSPFFVLIFSVLLLKEKITKKQLVALVLALIGAAFVIKPDFNYTIVPGLIGLSSAMLAGAAYTAVRKLSETDHPNTIVFYFSAIVMIGTIPSMLFSGNFVMPNLQQAGILMILSLSAISAQLLMTNGYRHAQASELAIYSYVNIIFSMIFGIIIWSEFPDVFTIIGAALIIIGGYINYSNR